MSSLVPFQAPDLLDPVMRLVLDAVSSPSTRTMYGKALTDFFRWRAEQGSPPFSRAAVQAHRAALETRGYAPSTVNQRLAAIKKLAREAAANGLLDAAVAAAIDQVPGVKQSGSRTGNWLTRAQAEALINAPDPATLKGQRDRALLALLVGCGLRRGEAVSLTAGHIQPRDGRWVIVDLRGKHGRLRSIAVPAWVKQAVDRWCATAAIADGRILRSLNRHGQITGDSLSPQAVLAVAVFYGDRLGLRLRPHDLRRTCAKLCRAGGGELEQIQLLLGHASIQTTERYLGTRQNLADAPNDRLRLEWKEGSTPIRAEFRHLYGRHWLTVTRPRILARARQRCERCKKPLHAWIFTYTWKTRDPQFSGVWRYHMIWIKEGSKVWRNQHGHPCSPLHAQGLPRKIRVKLTIAHADNNPANMDDSNLRCWCTWCHLHHDQPYHKETRCHRKDAARPILQDAT